MRRTSLRACGPSSATSPERKRSEEELRRYQEQLEEMVKERTAELAVATEQAEFANGPEHLPCQHEP